MDANIINSLPKGFIKIFAKNYISGNSEDSAISLSKKIYHDNNFSSTLDVLGEDIKEKGDINRYINIYLSLIQKINKLNDFPDNYTQPSISLKPSCFVLVNRDKNGQIDKERTDLQACYENIYKICDYAKTKNVRVTVEMEDHNWTDFTLETYFKLIKVGFYNVGTVIQTMLFRTENDLEKFDEKSRARVVIGIYREPKEIALKDREDMKAKLLKIAKILFDKGTFVEFATHDEKYIKQLFEEIIIPNKISNDKYEIQMLLGVPREKLQKDLISGEYLEKILLEKNIDWKGSKKVNFRLYLPFSESWDNALAYSKRRLVENPNIIAYGIKNLFIKK